MDPETLHSASFRNRDLIKAAVTVSCFSCLRVHPAIKVKEWTDEKRTALCPHCGIDAVLPGKFSKKDLQTMHTHWFTGIVVKQVPTTAPQEKP